MTRSAATRRRATILAVEILPPDDLRVGQRRTFRGELVVESKRRTPDGSVRLILRVVDIKLGRSQT